MHKIRIFLASLLAATSLIGSAHASGFATYFADIGATGGTNLGSGVKSSQRTALGSYTVTFGRNVKNGCAFTATVVGKTPAYATAQFVSGNTVAVHTFSKAGVSTNFPFTLFLACR